MYDKFNEKLPKYWVVKLTKENQEEFKNTVGKYINSQYKEWGYDQFDCYYGDVGHGNFGGSDFAIDIIDFSNNPTILTLQEFKSYFEEFKLPEKWCVLKNTQEICDWFNEISSTHYTLNSRNTHYIHQPAVDGDYRLYTTPIKGYTEITFEQFKKYVLKEDNMKKIIGYKLKKEQYLASARSIMGCDPKHNNWPIDIVRPDNTDCDKLKEAGVLDLWFEPVYEEEFKIGDWVTVIDNAKLRSWSNWENAVGYTFQLVEREQKGVFTRWLAGETTPYIAPDNRCRINFHISSVRKATPEEIAKAQSKELYFGKVKFTIESGKDYAVTEYGDVPKKDIKAAIDYIKNPPSLAGFEFSLHNPTKGSYTIINACSNQQHPDFAIGFGCRYGKLSELEAIYKAFD